VKAKELYAEFDNQDAEALARVALLVAENLDVFYKTLTPTADSKVALRAGAESLQSLFGYLNTRQEEDYLAIRLREINPSGALSLLHCAGRTSVDTPYSKFDELLNALDAGDSAAAARAIGNIRYYLQQTHGSAPNVASANLVSKSNVALTSEKAVIVASVAWDSVVTQFRVGPVSPEQCSLGIAEAQRALQLLKTHKKTLSRAGGSYLTVEMVARAARAVAKYEELAPALAKLNASIQAVPFEESAAAEIQTSFLALVDKIETDHKAACAAKLDEVLRNWPD
jgi:hypothetical protein